MVEKSPKKSKKNLAPDALSHSRDLLLALSRAAQSIQRARTAEEVYHAVGDQIKSLGGEVSLFMVNDDHQSLTVVHTSYAPSLIRCVEKMIGDSVIGYRFALAPKSKYTRYINTGKTIHVQSARKYVAATLPKDIHSLVENFMNILKVEQGIFAPLRVDDDTLGLMVVSSLSLNEGDVPAMESFAGQIAVSLHNMRLAQQMQNELSARKQAEEELRISEAKHQALLTAIPDILFMLNRDGIFLDFHAPKGRSLLMPPENFLGKNMRDVLPPQIVEVFSSAFNKAVQTGQNQLVEYDFDFSNKQHYYEEAHIIIGLEDNVLIILRDITVRKQADDELRKSEERYHALFDRMVDGFYRSTHAGKFVDVNPAMVKMFGYSSKEEMLAVDIKKDLYFSAEERGSHILDTGQEEVDVYHMKRKDGSEIWVEDHGYYVHDEQGNILFHEGILRDITARIEAEKELRESESQLRVLFEQMAVGVARINTHTGKFIQVNQKDCDIIGYSFKEMEALDFQSITHPDDLQSDLDNMELLKSGVIREYTMEKRLIHKDGSIVWVELTVSPMWAVGAMPDFHIAIVQDITVRRQMEDNSFLQIAALEAAANAIAITDRKGTIQWVNPAWTDLTGYSKEESIGQNARIIKSEEHDAAFYKIMWDTILAGKVWRGELVNRRKDGSLYYEEETITPVLNKHGEVTNFIAIKLNISKRKQADDDLRLAKEKLERANLELKFAFEHAQQLAHTDVLTGVNNRRYLFELAEHEFDVARRYQHPLSMIMFDLDHFKNINDTFGHATGDQMLERVTQIACSQLRDVDFIGRYGGEEFVIVLPVTNAQQAYLLAERIRAGVEALGLDTEKGTASVTLSIGIAEILHAPQDESVENIIHRADEALYAAKQAGRNRTVIFDTE